MKRKMKWFLMIVVVVAIICTYAITKSFFKSENKETIGAVIERMSDLNELTTAEAYTKVVIERENNKLFGQEIEFDMPGTKQKILVIIPGKVRSGVDLSQITKKDVDVDETNKTVTLHIPKAKILGDATVELDKVKVFSSEGLFRQEAAIKDGYSIANEAQKLMKQEAVEQGLLQMAEKNAEKALGDLFHLVDYKVVVQFKSEK